jgi:hypothetical protein
MDAFLTELNIKEYKIDNENQQADNKDMKDYMENMILICNTTKYETIKE